MSTVLIKVTMSQLVAISTCWKWNKIEYISPKVPLYCLNQRKFIITGVNISYHHIPQRVTVDTNKQSCCWWYTLSYYLDKCCQISPETEKSNRQTLLIRSTAELLQKAQLCCRVHEIVYSEVPPCWVGGYIQSVAFSSLIKRSVLQPFVPLSKINAVLHKCRKHPLFGLNSSQQVLLNAGTNDLLWICEADISCIKQDRITLVAV